MKRKLFAVVLAAIFITACPNPFLNEDKEKENNNNKGSKLAAPAGLEVSASSTSILLSWGAVINATGYKIYRGATATGKFTQVGTATLTVFSDTDIKANTTYYYKVAAYNSAGTGTQCAAVSTTASLPAPTAVFASASGTSIIISWTAVTGATGYYIYRSTSSYGTFSQVGTSTTTTYTNTGLSTSTTYYYKVAAYNSAGTTGSQSTYASATTVPAPPSTPTGLTAAAASTTSITIYWPSVSGATGYYIYRNTSPTGTYTQVGTSTTTTYTNTGLSTNTTYYYKVAAYNTGGTSSQSAYVSQNNGSAPQTAPTGLITTGATSSSVALSWDTLAGATGYNIYRSTSSGGTYSYVGTTTNNTYTNTGLSAGYTYYYKVAAYNSSGTGPQSASIYASTQYSSTYTISISGTPKVGQTLTVTTGGTGWTGDWSWGFADSNDASTYRIISGATSSTYTIPTSVTWNGTVYQMAGKYIRAFRFHPQGTWYRLDSYGNQIAGTNNFPSNYIGPIQP